MQVAQACCRGASSTGALGHWPRSIIYLIIYLPKHAPSPPVIPPTPGSHWWHPPIWIPTTYCKFEPCPKLHSFPACRQDRWARHLQAHKTDAHTLCCTELRASAGRCRNSAHGACALTQPNTPSLPTKRHAFQIWFAPGASPCRCRHQSTLETPRPGPGSAC